MNYRIKIIIITVCLAICAVFGVIIDETYGFEQLYKDFALSNKYDYNFVKFIDVGQGDCALIHSDDKFILIDAGINNDDGIKLSGKLREYDVHKIECIIVSHDDDDHAGGIYKILNDFDVKAIVCGDNSFKGDSLNTNNVLEAALKTGTDILTAEVGDSLSFGDAQFKFLWLDRETESNNNASLVTRLTMDGKVFLFGGDINAAVEKRIIESGVSVKCDVLKAAHHGSGYSSCDEFLDKAKPSYCVVSCSSDNQYGFPSESFLNRIHSRDIKLYVTAQVGDITFNTTDMEVYLKK